MTDSTPLIEFTDALILNGECPVIYNLNMTVNKGDFVYIIGKVGTGKTSLIRTIIAENPLIHGKGTVCGYSLNGIKNKDISMLRRNMGVVFQDFQLLMDRTVWDNLTFVLKCTGWKDHKACSDRIAQVLEDVGMITKAHKMPYQLSGGEQQRIAIARALLNSPSLIIADEPTGNLDADTADGIMQLLKAINRENRTAILMVTHNFSLLEKYPGRVFVCSNEQCLEKEAMDNIGKNTGSQDSGNEMPEIMPTVAETEGVEEMAGNGLFTDEEEREI